jgi:hypothetical protein
MRYTYTNLPKKGRQNTTIESFKNYQNLPIGIDSNVFASVTGFFVSKGFEETSAELIAEVIILQARQDELNPMQILDTLKGIDNVSISGLVAEILNFTRFKTSSLGYVSNTLINSEIERNIIA